MGKRIIFGILSPIVLILAAVGIWFGFNVYEYSITSDNPKEFKYPVSDLFYNKYVDGTPFIESNEYFPKYCEGRIDKLIKKKPLAIEKAKEEELQLKLNHWFNDEKKVKQDKEIYQSLTYEYSLLMKKEPLDCYSLKLSNGTKLFIRFDTKGEIYDDFKEGGYIFNSCEK